jgi:hypothetical protein
MEELAGNRENAQSLRVPAIRFQPHGEILCRAWKIVAPTPIHMMAVPVQLAEMEIGWVLRSAALYYPLVVDVETWSFNSQNG